MHCQEKVITNLESSYYVGKIFGNSYGIVNGTGNYAYDNMSGGAKGTGKFNTVGLTRVVSKDICLTKEFWEDTIELSAESWTVEDGSLPVLKTSGIDPAKELTSGEPPIYLAKTNTVSGTVKSAMKLEFRKRRLYFKMKMEQRSLRTVRRMEHLRLKFRMALIRLS